jgi:saxitoxin biosynthesis operon SxtJ-like protein
MNLLKIAWEKWKIFGHKVGNFQARIILGVFYFIVLCPFAAVVKFLSKPLRLKISHVSNWLAHEEEAEDIVSRARRQF